MAVRNPFDKVGKNDNIRKKTLYMYVFSLHVKLSFACFLCNLNAMFDCLTGNVLVCLSVCSVALKERKPSVKPPCIFV